MFGDYGYMEEGKLGKAYNYRLLKRLVPYAFPYKALIWMALCITLFMTLFELSLPYLSKIAIDRYILSAWYRVHFSNMEEDDREAFVNEFEENLQWGRDGVFALVPREAIRKGDPALLHRVREGGHLSTESFYKTSRDFDNALPATAKEGDILAMRDGSYAFPSTLLADLNKEELAKIRSGDLRGILGIGGVLLVFLFFSFWLGYGERIILERIGQRIMQDIRSELFERIQAQSVSFFDRHPVGRLVNRVTNDIENLNEMFKSVMVTIFKDIFILTGILVILLYLNWRLALVYLTLLPVVFGLTFLFSSLARDAFRVLREKVSKINAFLQESVTGMRIIQLFTRENYHRTRFAKINHENYRAGMRQIKVFGVFMPLMELISSFAVALLIWHGGGKVISEQLTLGALVAFIGYIQMFFRPIRDISEKYNIMQAAMASTERILEFMDHHEEIPEPLAPSVPQDIRGHLTFDHVSFAYSDGPPVLKEVSFEVKPGEMVAVVGATGAGKSTLVNLIERFYDPLSGAIFLDGIDIRNLPKRKLREQIALVLQDVFIFGGDLKENIALGQEHMGMDTVEKATKMANAEALVSRLPSGYGQIVGERGSTLSVGERQLLSFARALARNPKILILDEATSSVDPETERLIQKAIIQMSEKRTTLVVAHRLSTIRQADRILVMHHGRIREQGTHDELVAMGGIYAKLNQYREMN
jgi:ABC-type multidrug transport system fused ATPase/permease subunit